MSKQAGVNWRFFLDAAHLAASAPLNSCVNRDRAMLDSGELYVFSATSTATHDGDLVVKPNDANLLSSKPSAGRWLKIVFTSDDFTVGDGTITAAKLDSALTAVIAAKALVTALSVDKGVRYHKAAVQSIGGNDVDTKVLLDTSDYDTGTLWSAGDNGFKIVTAGKYLIVGGAALAGSSNTLPDFEADIFLNGAAVASMSSHKHDTDHIPVTVAWMGLLAVNDIVTLSVAQDSAAHAAINIEAGAWLALQKVDKAGA